MNIKRLTDYNLGFLSLRGGCISSSESTHVKMPHCLKSRVAVQNFVFEISNCDNAIYTMDHPECVVFSFMEKFIGLKKVNNYMYPPVPNIPEVVDWKGIRIRKVRHKQFATSSLQYCKYAALIYWKKNTCNSPIDWQDVWVKDFICAALACVFRITYNTVQIKCANI